MYALVRRRRKWLVIPAMIGGASLLADGIITPPISITSAIEGLKNIPLLHDISTNTIMYLVLAILLVTIGLHGLIAYLTVSRTNEIGIRLSLGATRAQIVRLVVRDSVLMVAIGVVIGVPLAVLAMRAARTLLFGLSIMDLPTMAVAVLALAVVAAAAGWLPAWRASRFDPAVVLRAD